MIDDTYTDRQCLWNRGPNNTLRVKILCRYRGSAQFVGPGTTREIPFKPRTYFVEVLEEGYVGRKKDFALAQNLEPIPS